jgi:hypothetical protein
MRYLHGKNVSFGGEGGKHALSPKYRQLPGVLVDPVEGHPSV